MPATGHPQEQLTRSVAPGDGGLKVRAGARVRHLDGEFQKLRAVHGCPSGFDPDSVGPDERVHGTRVQWKITGTSFPRVAPDSTLGMRRPDCAGQR